MRVLENLQPQRVFNYFEEISAIPRGSRNMDGISNYCVEFAKAHSLWYKRDDYNNVIIYKDGSMGYEDSEPIILQGHLDMVCQKTIDSDFDFEKDGLKLCIDGDYIDAEDTTLGADNGIAVAMILAILDSNDISHPPIEAVFTTDEEIGMLGAIKLKSDYFKAKKMINLDSEDIDTMTVSCAGGSDFIMSVDIDKEQVTGTKIILTVKGLKGGHSGVEINSGRVNANMLMGRILNYANSITDYDVISINGGDKANAIPLMSVAEIVVKDTTGFRDKLDEYCSLIKDEINDREPAFDWCIEVCESQTYNVISRDVCDKIVFALVSSPNGVTEMSAVIENLVQTSLNLGILQTYSDKIIMHFALRSNKKSALQYLEDRLMCYANFAGFKTETFGHYPPWEYNDKSSLQKLYIDAYEEKIGEKPKVVALHAGLECGIFASMIDDFDCISVGPQMYDVHTTGERLSISSVKTIFELLLVLLERCK